MENSTETVCFKCLKKIQFDQGYYHFVNGDVCQECGEKRVMPI